MRTPMWLEQSERGEEREEGRAERGQGRSCRSLWATGRTWAFTPREVGALEGCGQRGDKVRLTSEFGKMLSPKQYLSLCDWPLPSRGSSDFNLTPV